MKIFGEKFEEFGKRADITLEYVIFQYFLSIIMNETQITFDK